MYQLISLLLLAIASTPLFAASEGAYMAQPSSLPSIIMLVLFILVFYFLLIRPQMKRNKEQRALMNALQKGDEVITTSGMYGTIESIDNAIVHLEIADKVVIKIQKQAIISLLPKGSVASK